MQNDDEILELLIECFVGTSHVNHLEEPNYNANKFYKLLRDLQHSIYKGSKCL